MKMILIVSAALFMHASTFAQNINWQSINPQQKHIINFNSGIDYSTSFGLGYGYHMKIDIGKLEMPVVLQAQVSFPAGDDLVDDFKSKLGGQVRVYKTGNFSATVLMCANFRGQQTELVKMQSFGSEFTGVFGYYKPGWYVAAELGFDKAIVTHINHTGLMREFYPEAKTGWYVPTGGNVNAGIQGGYSIKTFDVTLRTGKLWNQNFISSPRVPFYMQVGVSKRF